MMNWSEIIKKFAKLMSFGLVIAVLSVSADNAMAESLPWCSQGTAASVKCKCGREGDNVFNPTCNVGQVCSIGFSDGADDIAVNICTNLENAKNSSKYGYTSTVSATNSADFDNPCNSELQCSPACYFNKIKNKCTFCSLFATFFRTASYVTRDAIDSYSGSVRTLVVVAFAVWIAFQALAFVSSPETKDIKDFILSLMTQGFVVLLVFAILQGSAFSFFNTALGPIFNTGVRAAQTIIRPADIEKSANKSKNGITVQTFDCSNLAQKPEYYLPPTSSKTGERLGALPVSMGEGVMCTMGLIQQRVAWVRALGSSGMCYAWQKKKLLLVPHLGYLLTGMGLWTGATVLILVVPFMMIDSVIRMAIAGILLPFAIGSYAFKATRQYSRKVWQTFMEAMFLFVFISLVALMVTTAFEQTISGTFDKVASKDTTLWLAITTDEVSLADVLDRFAWFTTAFLEIGFVMIMAWAVIGQAKEFAKEFSGGLSTEDIASKTATMGASAAKSAVKGFKKPAEAVSNELWRMTKNGTSGAIGGLRNGFREMQAQRIMRRTGQANANGQFVENRTRRFLGIQIGRQVSRTVMQTGDGRHSVVTDRSNKDGSKSSSKIKSDVFTIKTTKNQKSGHHAVYHDDIKINSMDMITLFKRDGKVNATANDNLMQMIKGHPLEEKLMIAYHKSIMKQQMPNLREQGYTEQKVIRDEQNNIVGYEETHADGSKTFVETHMENNRIMLHVTKIDKNGKGKVLSTDGAINRKRTFSEGAGFDINKVNGSNYKSEIKAENAKSAYSYTKHYEYYNKQGLYGKLDKGMETSIFSAQEARNARIFTSQHNSSTISAQMHEFGDNF